MRRSQSITPRLPHTRAVLNIARVSAPTMVHPRAFRRTPKHPCTPHSPSNLCMFHSARTLPRLISRTSCEESGLKAICLRSPLDRGRSGPHTALVFYHVDLFVIAPWTPSKPISAPPLRRCSLRIVFIIIYCATFASTSILHRCTLPHLSLLSCSL